MSVTTSQSYTPMAGHVLPKHTSRLPDPNTTDLNITQIPSEPSEYTLASPSSFELRQRLLDLQPKPGSFETYREMPHWESSFPPAAYYITPPPYTPEEPLVSTSTGFQEIRQSNEVYFDGSGRCDIEAQDHAQLFSPTSSNSVPSRHGDEYYLSHPDSEQQDMEFSEAQRNKEPPYAELLYNCLSEAPGRQMILKDIYEWFKINTDKTNNPDVKGWMNSIRHNLSMNQVRI
jgi:Forkhead domain